MNLLVSGSWDKTLRYWDLRQQSLVHTQQLPDRCYGLTVRHPLMVVATADRNIIAFNLQNPQINRTLVTLGGQETTENLAIKTDLHCKFFSSFILKNFTSQIPKFYISLPAFSVRWHICKQQ
ncbi:hypothetical protein L2E82_51423 [Cichorium intybus]|nr:hypothetical protein L2E82_51423 [Cichorium intybus]